MLSRKALIIGAPDEKIPGVKVDMENLRAYLRSPVGGLWYESEISTLLSPTEREIRKQLELLATQDYSFVFFAGHGYHSIERKRTILKINPQEHLDSLELRRGAPKHTVILDCCRVPQSDRLVKAFMESVALDSARGQKLNPFNCRYFFNKAISDCGGGVVVMNGCAIGEEAGESGSSGGYYTSSVIDAGTGWAEKMLASIDLSKHYATYSTRECHTQAAAQVKLLSGGRQTPDFEAPRTEKTFPFAVVA